MNSCDLYLAFNAIDDDILEQSEYEVRTVPFWGKHHVLKRCVAACLAVVIAFTGLMSVEACRRKIIEVITQVFPDATYFTYHITGEPTYTTLPKVELTYIPDGFELIDSSVFNGVLLDIYENADGDFFEVTLMLMLPNSTSGRLLDTEKKDVEYIYIGDIKATAHDSPKAQSIMWEYENIQCDLYGIIGLDELKKIASGMVFGEPSAADEPLVDHTESDGSNTSITAADEPLVCYAESDGSNTTIIPDYFPRTIDRNYENLAWTEMQSSGKLTFSVNWDAKELIVGENYYERTSPDSVVIHQETYTLLPNADGTFELKVLYKNPGEEEKAIYFIQGETGKYGMKIVFNSDENNESVNLPADKIEEISDNYDFDYDGIPETVERVTYSDDASQSVWFELQVKKADGTILWKDEAYTAHSGYNSLFVCKLDGKDYLLQYYPTMYQGSCNYGYQLFSLDAQGNVLPHREAAVSFDINWDYWLHEEFDAGEIADFMDEVNGLLATSKLLMSTDSALADIDPEHPQDIPWWLLDKTYCAGYVYDESKSLRENLLALEKIVNAH